MKETKEVHKNRKIGKIEFIDDKGKKEGYVVTNHHFKYYEAIFNAMEISAKKNHDYAGGLHIDPLANFKKAEEMGLTGFQGLWMRSLDKVNRVNTYLREGKLMVENEGVEDALSDLLNYCALAMAVLYDETEKNK